MGREINRVPMDFDWPIGQTWMGFAVHVKFPECPDCRVDDSTCVSCRHRYTHSSGYGPVALEIKDGLRSGAIRWPDGVDQWDTYRALQAVAEARGVVDELTCSRCDGYGDLATPELRAWEEAIPTTPIPPGDGWQLWETVGDSPMSPVFATSDELVEWMIVNPWMLGPSFGPSLVVSDRQTAERFVAVGWAPSFITTNDSTGVTVVDGVTAVTSPR